MIFLIQWLQHCYGNTSKKINYYNIWFQPRYGQTRGGADYCPGGGGDQTWERVVWTRQTPQGGERTPAGIFSSHGQCPPTQEVCIFTRVHLFMAIYMTVNTLFVKYECLRFICQPLYIIRCLANLTFQQVSIDLVLRAFPKTNLHVFNFLAHEPKAMYLI